MKMGQQARQPSRNDEVAQTHTKMLKAPQSKSLEKDECAEKITTTIETNGRTHSFETYKTQNGGIDHNIRTFPSKPSPQVAAGEENKERGA